MISILKPYTVERTATRTYASTHASTHSHTENKSHSDADSATGPFSSFDSSSSASENSTAEEGWSFGVTENHAGTTYTVARTRSYSGETTTEYGDYSSGSFSGATWIETLYMGEGDPPLTYPVELPSYSDEQGYSDSFTASFSASDSYQASFVSNTAGIASSSASTKDDVSQGTCLFTSKTRAEYDGYVDIDNSETGTAYTQNESRPGSGSHSESFAPGTSMGYIPVTTTATTQGTHYLTATHEAATTRYTTKTAPGTTDPHPGTTATTVKRIGVSETAPHTITYTTSTFNWNGEDMESFTYSILSRTALGRWGDSITITLQYDSFHYDTAYYRGGSFVRTSQYPWSPEGGFSFYASIGSDQAVLAVSAESTGTIDSDALTTTATSIRSVKSDTSTAMEMMEVAMGTYPLSILDIHTGKTLTFRSTTQRLTSSSEDKTGEHTVYKVSDAYFSEHILPHTTNSSTVARTTSVETSSRSFTQEEGRDEDGSQTNSDAPPLVLATHTVPDSYVVGLTPVRATAYVSDGDPAWAGSLFGSEFSTSNVAKVATWWGENFPWIGVTVESPPYDTYNEGGMLLAVGSCSTSAGTIVAGFTWGMTTSSSADAEGAYITAKPQITETTQYKIATNESWTHISHSSVLIFDTPKSNETRIYIEAGRAEPGLAGLALGGGRACFKYSGISAYTSRNRMALTPVPETFVTSFYSGGIWYYNTISWSYPASDGGDFTVFVTRRTHPDTHTETDSFIPSAIFTHSVMDDLAVRPENGIIPKERPVLLNNGVYLTQDSAGSGTIAVSAPTTSAWPEPIIIRPINHITTVNTVVWDENPASYIAEVANTYTNPPYIGA